MKENIENVNIEQQTREDMKAYAIYVARCRAIPDAIDGLKPVIRRILWCAAHDFRGQGSVKTAAILGEVIKSYNPHGDSSVHLAIRNMINNFSTKYPTMVGVGGWGSKVNPYPAAARYSHCGISKFSIDVFMRDIMEDKRATDWMNNYSNTKQEPVYLPAKIPTLLILGQMGIGVGMKSSIPSHNLGEVIDTTISLIHNPNAKFCLIPDECMACEIIDTDWQTINNTGRGNYIAQGIVDIGEYNNHPALYVRSLPDFTYYDSIKESIIKLVESKKMPYIIDLVSRTKTDLKSLDNSTKFEEVIVLKKGTDPNFVKEFLYANTQMRQTRQVSMIVIDHNQLKGYNYRQYLLGFIEFRRSAIARSLNARLQKCNTIIHQKIPYLKLLNSKDCDKIIHAIRSQSGTDDQKLIDYLIKKLNITPLQASYLIDLKLKNLSKGYLQKAAEDVKRFQQEANKIMEILLDPKKIDKVMIEQMLEIKAKYNTPILRKMISKSQAAGIAPGTFKIIFTKKNFIRKISENEMIGSLGNDEYNFSLIAENQDNLMVFSVLGKVFKIPVHKIPITAKGSNGMDIRLLNKYATSNMCCAASESLLTAFTKKSKVHNFIFVCTRNGYIKKIDIEDILTAPNSGIIYSKVEEGDYVQSILFGPDKMDLLVKIGDKVLRVPGKQIPYLKRSTRGARISTSTAVVDSMSFVNPNCVDLVVVTKNGMVNKLGINIIEPSNRGRAGIKVIKLKKDDNIISVIPALPNSSLVVYEGGRSNTVIPLDKIPYGTTASPGIKLLKNPIRVMIQQNQ